MAVRDGKGGGRAVANGGRVSWAVGDMQSREWPRPSAVRLAVSKL